MISTLQKEVRLGYSQTGGEARLRIDELQGKLLILGTRADEMAAIFAYASREAGLRPLILDLDGYLSSRVSGYFQTYRLADVLYDLYRMDERAPRWHGELISSAYTAALDLTFEEEAILDAATQHLASQDDMASPPVVYDALSSVEGFRGFYVDKLKGRVGTLKYLDAADSVSLTQVLASTEGAIVDLSGSRMPRATELGAALLIAKLVATIETIPPQDRPSFVMVNSAHRVFRLLPKTLHGNRLFMAMLASPMTSVLVSDQVHALSPLILQAFPVRISSAEAWRNQVEKDKGRWRSSGNHIPGRWGRPTPPLATPPVLPNSFVLEDAFYGVAQPFVPRPFLARRVAASIVSEAEGDFHPDEAEKKGQSSPSAADGALNLTDPVLAKRILQEVKAYESPSMPSVISYLSAEFPKDAIERAINGLEKDGLVKLSPKEQKSGRTMLALELTQKGAEFLGRVA